MFHRDGPELMNNMHSRKKIQSKDLVVYTIMSGKSCIGIDPFDNNPIEKMIFSQADRTYSMQVQTVAQTKRET